MVKLWDEPLATRPIHQRDIGPTEKALFVNGERIDAVILMVAPRMVRVFDVQRREPRTFGRPGVSILTVQAAPKAALPRTYTRRAYCIKPGTLNQIAARDFPCGCGTVVARGAWFRLGPVAGHRTYVAQCALCVRKESHSDDSPNR